MSDIYVVYWSGTGNTEAMADAVKDGIEAAGGSAKVLEVSAVSAADLKDEPAFALGCPAMGDEELDSDMEALVAEVETFASGKKIGLFGSYEWNDGEWMRTWSARMEAAGADIVTGAGVTAYGAPDDEATAACRALGEALVK